MGKRRKEEFPGCTCEGWDSGHLPAWDTTEIKTQVNNTRGGRLSRRGDKKERKVVSSHLMLAYPVSAEM